MKDAQHGTIHSRKAVIGTGDSGWNRCREKSDGYINLNGGKEIVTWCYGHILAQLNPDEYSQKYRAWRMEDLPIIPSHWKLKVKPEAAKQFKIIRELIGKVEEIIHAGDSDRGATCSVMKSYYVA